MKVKEKESIIEITSIVQIPKDLPGKWGVEEVAFSPNPFDPVIVYEVSQENNQLFDVVAYIQEQEKLRRR